MMDRRLTIVSISRGRLFFLLFFFFVSIFLGEGRRAVAGFRWLASFFVFFKSILSEALVSAR